MGSRRLVEAIALSLALIAPAAAAEGMRVGVAGAVEPGVTAIAPDGKSHALAAGEDIGLKDKIVTDAQGKTEILFLDHSSLRISPNSEIVVEEFVYAPDTGAGSLTAEVDKGLFRFAGGDLSKNAGGVKIKTPTTILGVRGGIALIEIGDQGATRATFLYGNALTVGTLNGQVVEITRPGFFTEVGRNGIASSPAQVNTAALAQKIIRLQASAHGGSTGGGTKSVITYGKLRQEITSNAALRDLSTQIAPIDIIDVLGFTSQSRNLPNAQSPRLIQGPGPTAGMGEPGMGVTIGH
jgi:hypothetical protein